MTSFGNLPDGTPHPNRFMEKICLSDGPQWVFVLTGKSADSPAHRFKGVFWRRSNAQRVAKHLSDLTGGGGVYDYHILEVPVGARIPLGQTEMEFAILENDVLEKDGRGVFKLPPHDNTITWDKICRNVGPRPEPWPTPEDDPFHIAAVETHWKPKPALPKFRKRKKTPAVVEEEGEEPGGAGEPEETIVMGGDVEQGVAVGEAGGNEAEGEDAAGGGDGE